MPRCWQKCDRASSRLRTVAATAGARGCAVEGSSPDGARATGSSAGVVGNVRAAFLSSVCAASNALRHSWIFADCCCIVSVDTMSTAHPLDADVIVVTTLASVAVKFWSNLTSRASRSDAFCCFEESAASCRRRSTRARLVALLLFPSVALLVMERTLRLARRRSNSADCS